MDFTYTRRTLDGKLEDLSISASSRAEVFQILRKQGITPVSVRVVNGSSHVSSRFQFSRIVTCSILCVPIAVGLVLFLVYDACPRTEQEDRPPKTRPTVPTKTEFRQKIASDMPSPTTSPRDADSGPAKPKTAKEVLADLLTHPPAVTNYMVGITVTTNRPRRIYRNATEQMLASLFRTELGSIPPPMPQIPMRDNVNIDEILSNHFSITDADSETSSTIKDVVNQAKQVMKEFLDQGGTPESFISYYRNELQHCYETWKMCQQSAIKSCREDDPEVAREMIDKINESLSEKGIKPVNLPPRFREKLGIK